MQINNRVYICFFCGDLKECDTDIPEPFCKDIEGFEEACKPKNRKFICPECYKDVKKLC